MMSNLGQTAIKIALSQYGVQEQPKGSNGGPEVNQYLRAVGLGPGNSWCMAFVYWCIEQACQKIGQVNPLVKTGHVLHQWNTTKLKKLLPKDIALVKQGDIFIMDFGGGQGHAGLVITKDKGFAITTEGNSNDEGSRDGYELVIRNRAPATLKGFIQLP